MSEGCGSWWGAGAYLQRGERGLVQVLAARERAAARRRRQQQQLGASGLQQQRRRHAHVALLAAAQPHALAQAHQPNDTCTHALRVLTNKRTSKRSFQIHSEEFYLHTNCVQNSFWLFI